MKDNITVKDCEDFILDLFRFVKEYVGDDEVNVDYFWSQAFVAGLWQPGIRGGPISVALGRMTEVRTYADNNSAWMFVTFKLKLEGETK